MTIIALLLAAAPAAQIHLRVDGDGFFRFAHGAQAVYSADAVLTTATGVLATTDGYPVLPKIRVPSDGSTIQVAIDGSVTASGKMLGRIVLATFDASELSKTGSYLTTTAHGSIGYPGEGIFGIIRTVGASSHSVEKAAVTVPDSSGSTIEVALRTEVTKPEILLGDIATITANKRVQDEIEAMDLGATPMLGVERGITRSQIATLLRRAGLDPDSMQIICPAGAIVIRKGQKVPEDAMVAAAAAEAKTRLGIECAMRCDHPVPDALVPVGELQLTVRDVIANGDGASVNLEIDVDGKVVGTRTISLVPTVPTPKVNMGDPVKVRIIRNGASVEVAGKVRAAGRVGSTISVETDGGAVFSGTLKTTALVEVKL